MTESAGPRLGHVHLEVRDLERSIDFYRRLVGLEITELTGRFAFLSFGEQHHDLALQQIVADRKTRDDPRRPPLERPGETRPGLYHLAFELPSSAALTDVAELLRADGWAFDLVDHGISHALYTRDPDGHGVEVYVDRRHRPEGRREWGGRSTPASAAARRAQS